MGQEDIIKLLEKETKPLTRKEIAELLEENASKISRILQTLLKFNEINYIEIDRKEAMKSYGCKRRMKKYFL